MKKREWYSISAKADEEAEIYIYDSIGDSFFSDSVSAKDFVNALRPLDGSDIHLRINSPGGDVFDGTAIYNALIEHSGRVRVTIDGLAASMASVIAMAGETIVMPENAMLMIHDPWTMAVGSADEIRKTAEILDKAKIGLISAYKRTGLSRDAISDLMTAETWMTGAEAVEKGFADEVTEPVRIAASADFPWIANRPEALKRCAIDVPEVPKGRKVAVARRRMAMAR